MKLEIAEYERCETTSSGSIEDHLIGITKPSIDRMLKTDNPADCIALYTFYCYTRKWQNNSAPKATSDYAMDGLKWGRDRFSKAKAALLELGLIEDVQRRDVNGRVIGWYIGVKFAQNATLGTFKQVEIPDSHPTGFPQGGESTVWENRTQIPNTSNKIPNTNKQMQVTSRKSSPMDSLSHGDELPLTDVINGADAQAGKANALDSLPPNAANARASRNPRKSPPMERPSDVSEENWLAFCDLRKTKRAPVTINALNLLRKEAGKAGWSLDDAINECVLRNWQGFKAEWLKKDKSKTVTPYLPNGEIDWANVKPRD